MRANVLQGLNPEVAKKIFGSKEKAKEFLNLSGKKLAAEDDVWVAICLCWNYNLALPVVRKMFLESEKALSAKNAPQELQGRIADWRRLGLGPIAWPCSQGAFDSLVQRVNQSKKDPEQKDASVTDGAVRYRRVKEINTLRNDYLEYLIVSENKNVMPTLTHRRGVDYFIDGEAYDQKVAKSPTVEFKEKYGKDWADVARQRPDEVARYLYTYQDEGRFGADPRLYIVYLEEDVPVGAAERAISSVSWNKPLQISFDFKTKAGKIERHTTTCFAIILAP